MTRTRLMATMVTSSVLLAILGIGSPAQTTLAARSGSRGPLPRSCPAAAVPTVVSHYLRPAVGTSPLWAVAFADGSLFLGDPRVVARRPSWLRCARRCGPLRLRTGACAPRRRCAAISRPPPTCCRRRAGGQRRLPRCSSTALSA